MMMMMMMISQVIIIIIEGLSLLQSIPPTTADKQTQAQKRRGSRSRKLLGAKAKSYRLLLEVNFFITGYEPSTVWAMGYGSHSYSNNSNNHNKSSSRAKRNAKAKGKLVKLVKLKLHGKQPQQCRQLQ